MNFGRAGQSDQSQAAVSAMEDDMKNWMPVLSVVFLAACASYSGGGLKPGESRLEDVQRVMGEPAMRWQDADGSLQLAYPRGPAGYHTYMANFGADGRLQGIRNVLEPESFQRIRPGMTKDEVLRALGPSQPAWTAYFKARDELVWEWRYCDNWGDPSRFDVLFDGSQGTVRSTLSLVENQNWLGEERHIRCSR
jgi:hypothetical protein